MLTYFMARSHWVAYTFEWEKRLKSHVEPPWEDGKKFYINGSGHMTKMIAMPIYGKNLKNSSPTDLIVLCS